MENKDLLEVAKTYGFIQDKEVWLKPFMNFPARKVGEVKDVEDESLQYFAHRFEMFREKVNALLAKIESSENKGSFLMKVLHLKEQVEKFDALGDFESIHSLLANAENEIKAAISRNRDKNLSTKIGLITDAEALQESVDWKMATEKFKELRQNWIKTGPIDKALEEEIETRFKNSVEHFFNRKKDFFEDKQAMLNRTIDKYKDLIARSEALKNSDEWDETTVKLKQLQDEWKTIGGTLPRKLSNELWTSFRSAHNHFFNRLKNKISQTKVDSKDKYMEENLEKKKDLVKQAESLLGLPSQEATTKAKDLQAAWKKVGPVKGPESDAVWDQFTNACDRIFELSSLEHFMRKKGIPADNPITPEQANARINALKDFIKSDKQELEVLEENMGKLNPNPNNETFRTMLLGKIKTFNRKINTKNALIELFKSQITVNQESK